MNMKEIFPEYFKDKEEVEEIWNNCVFVFDANVIIDLYRYSESTKESLLKSLKYFKEQVWIPRQASEEYLRNRALVIASEETYYTEALNEIDGFLSKFKKLLEKGRQHPFISEKSTEDFYKAIDKMKHELNENGKKYLSRVSDDEIRKVIVEIFDGRVGEGLNDDELNKLFDEGVDRYKNKKPPGYEDVGKLKEVFEDGANLESIKLQDKKRVFGDLIIWKEIINKSIKDEKNIILITGDDKEDWWGKSKGKSLGPRVELIKEFEESTGQKFYMYTTHNFLKISSKQIGGASDEAAVEEIKEVRFVNTENSFSNKAKNINIGDVVLEISKAREAFKKLLENKLDNEVFHEVENKNENDFDDYNYFESRKYIVKNELTELESKIWNLEAKIDRNKARLIELYENLDRDDNRKLAKALENNNDHLKKRLSFLTRELSSKRLEEEFLLFGREDS